MAGVDISLTLSSSTRSTSALLTEAQKKTTNTKRISHTFHALFSSQRPAILLYFYYPACATSTSENPVPSGTAAPTQAFKFAFKFGLNSPRGLFFGTKNPNACRPQIAHTNLKKERARPFVWTQQTTPTRIDTAARWAERGKKRRRKKQQEESPSAGQRSLVCCCQTKPDRYRRAAAKTYGQV